MARKAMIEKSKRKPKFQVRVKNRCGRCGKIGRRESPNPTSNAILLAWQAFSLDAPGAC